MSGRAAAGWAARGWAAGAVAARSWPVVASLAAAIAFVVPAPAAAQHEAPPPPVHGDMIFWKVLAERVELVAAGEGTAAAWEVQGWIGGDHDRLWMKLEGEGAAQDGELELHVLYSRLIAPYWDVQAGVRYDRRLGDGDDLQRAHLVVGLEGLAPYWFQVEPAVFVSDDGDVSARLEASVDLLLTQRLVLQPELEINAAVQRVEEWDVGSGLNDLSINLRLRYELRREIAPYIGIDWRRRFGDTGDAAVERGEEKGRVALLAGLRAWF